jgi:hypothetical protein
LISVFSSSAASFSLPTTSVSMSLSWPESSATKARVSLRPSWK